MKDQLGVISEAECWKLEMEVGGEKRKERKKTDRCRRRHMILPPAHGEHRKSEHSRLRTQEQSSKDSGTQKAEIYPSYIFLSS